VTWEQDFLRFHSAVLSVDNPGERVLEHLPPGHYSAQRVITTQTESRSQLMTMGERQLFEVESGKQVDIRFERKTGRRLTGRVTGLENSELKYAHLTINHLGPEEVLSQDGKRNRMYVAPDVLAVVEGDASPERPEVENRAVTQPT